APGDPPKRDSGRVRRHDRLRREVRLESSEQFLFDCQVFDDRLDDPIRSPGRGKIVEAAGPNQLEGLGLKERVRFEDPQTIPSVRGGLRRDVEQQHRKPGIGEMARDLRAHGSGAEDSRRPERSMHTRLFYTSAGHPMTFHIRRGLVRLLPLVFVVFGWVLVSTVGAWTQAADKTIFVTVLDSDNKPVKDIGAAEFGVREDTVVREVTSRKGATKPLFLTVLADTSKVTGGGGFSAGSTELIRDIRKSLTSFVKQISAASPDAQMSLMEFGQAA